MFDFNVMVFFLCFFLATGLIYLLKPSAVYLGLVDRPNVRKHHKGDIPLVGGLGVFSSCVIACSFLGILDQNLMVFFVAGMILIVVGVIDDFRELSATLRFIAQIGAASIMVFWGGGVVLDLGALTWNGALFTLGLFAVPFTVFATVGVINAVNMSDGVDGLSGSLVLITFISLAIVSIIEQRYTELQLLLIFMAAVIAFLGFNFRFPWRKHADVFMGDAGSMFLGFTIAWFFVQLTQGSERVVAPVTVLWFMVMPLFDTVGIMLRRILKGRSPFAADREHFHHVLLLAGFSVTQSVLIICTLAGIGVVIGLVGQYLHIPELLMLVLFLFFFACYFYGMHHAWKVMRFLKRSICRRTVNQDRRQQRLPFIVERRVMTTDRRVAPLQCQSKDRRDICRKSFHTCLVNPCVNFVL